MRLSLCIVVCLLPFYLSAQEARARVDDLNERAFQLQDSQPDSAFRCAMKARYLAEALPYKSGLAAAYMRLGSLHQLRAQMDSALFYLKRSLALRQELKDYQGVCNACYVLNHTFRQADQIDSAFYMTYMGLRIATKHHLTLEEAEFLFELGDLNLAYGESDTALYYFEEAHARGLAMKDSAFQLKALFGLAAYYYAVENVDRALQYFLEGRKYIDSTQNRYAWAISHNNLAACYDQLKQPKAAKIHYKRSIVLYREMNLPIDAAQSMNSLGALYYRLEEYDSALYWYNRAFPSLRQSESHTLLLDNLLFQSLAYEKRQQPQLALSFYKQYAQYKDSVLNAEKVASIAEMQSLYDTEKKEAKIELLDEQRKTSAAQRNFTLAVASALFLALCFLAYFYWQRLQMNKRDRLLAQERIDRLLNRQETASLNSMLRGQNEERQRISQELHDRVGSLLAAAKLHLEGGNSYEVEANNRAIRTLDEAVEEVRRVSHNLSTSKLSNYGLVSAVQDLVDGVDQSGLLRCKAEFYGMDERLGTALEIEIYRIIQEAINNTLKYAEARLLHLQLHCDEREIRLTIEDDGVGFDPSELGPSSGLGLLHMQTRAENLKASFQIESSKGKGTIISLEIPKTPITT